MSEAWQTKIMTFLPFPWRCANMQIEESTELPHFFSGTETTEEGLEEDELAFWCVFGHRILKSECLGDSCPYCKLVDHDEYIKRLGAC